MLVNIILVVGLYFVGAVFASYGLGMPLMLLRVSVPLTRLLGETGMINTKTARKQTAASLVFWVVIDAVVIALMITFANTFAWVGFGVGVFFSIFGVLRRSGANNDNLSDFIQSYRRHLTVSADEVAAFFYLK